MFAPLCDSYSPSASRSSRRSDAAARTIRPGPRVSPRRLAKRNKSRRPPVDDQRAEDALLSAADLGDGWTSYDMGGDPIVSRETKCLRFDDGALVETAQALSDVSSLGPPSIIVAGKPFGRASHVAASSARLYETEADAETAFERIVAVVRARPLFYCLARANTSREGPRLVGAETYYFPAGRFPKIAEQQWVNQYELRLEKKSGRVWIDIVVVRQERAIGTLYFSSLEIPQLQIEPVTNEEVQQAAKELAQRLAP